MSLSRSIVHSVAASTDPLLDRRFTFGQLQGLFEVYASSGSVKGMSIRGYRLSAAACAEIGTSLRTLKRKLSLLDFAYCSIGDQGAINVIRALADCANGGEVHELVFRLCRLSPDFGCEVGRIFFHIVGKNSSGLKQPGNRPFGNLRAIDFSFNALGCKGAASVIRYAPHGLQLDLSYTGLDIDACTNLTDLELALANTEVASILFFGAGDSVTSHLFRKRHLSQTRKERQQVVDAKCLLAAENPQDVQCVTGGITEATIRPDLQFCRFGAPSLTLYLDGDIDAPNPQDCHATQAYLASENPETEQWNERLFKEVVAIIGEPIFKTPDYRPSRNYPPFVRGEVAGVYRVRDGRSSTVFSARSASGIATSRSNSPNGRGNNNSRSASAANNINNLNRSTSAGLIRTATKRSASANDSNNNNNLSRTNTGRSTSSNHNNIQEVTRVVADQQQDDYKNQGVATTTHETIVTDIPSRSGSAYPPQAVGFDHNNNNNNYQQTVSTTNWDPFGRTASVMTTLTQPVSTNLVRPPLRTPFERNSAPVLNTNSNRHANPEQEARDRELNLMLSPRSAVGQHQQPFNGDRSISGSSRISTKAQIANSNNIDLVASHLSPPSVVKRGRALAPLSGPTLIIIKDMSYYLKQKLLQELLRACVVSDSQCERIFGLTPLKEFLGPNQPPSSFRGSRNEKGELLGGNLYNAADSEQQQVFDGSALVDEVPSALLQANGCPSYLMKQPAVSEQRIAGIAKILFYLLHCDLPEQQDIKWITQSNTVDLPEFLRSFGDGQRTVVQFRSQRSKEDAAAKKIVDAFMKSAGDQQKSGGKRLVLG